MAKPHFKKRSEEETKSVKTLIGWTPDEAAKVRAAAKHRSLPVAEFIRRAALGRRADVDFVTDIVLSVSDLTKAIRELHAAMIQQGITPPSDELLSLIVEGRAAMLRISK